jgi:hypothetical protein
MTADILTWPAGVDDAFGILTKDLVYCPTIKPTPNRNSIVKSVI